MGKIKGKLSVRKAVEKCFPELPRKFTMNQLHYEVCRETCRTFINLDTTRRKAFELREEGLIKFVCEEKAKSIYHKTDRL
jgi:hypothetical protein